MTKKKGIEYDYQKNIHTKEEEKKGMAKTKVKPNWADPATTADNEVLPRYFKWAWTS